MQISEGNSIACANAWNKEEGAHFHSQSEADAVDVQRIGLGLKAEGLMYDRIELHRH